MDLSLSSLIGSAVLFVASVQCHTIPSERSAINVRGSIPASVPGVSGADPIDHVRLIHGSRSTDSDDDPQQVSTATIVIAVVVPVVAILLFGGIIYYTYRRSDVKTPMSPYSKNMYNKVFGGYEETGFNGGGGRRSIRSSTISRNYDSYASRALMGADMGKVWPVPRPFSYISKKSGNSGRFSMGSNTWYPDTPKSKGTPIGGQGSFPQARAQPVPQPKPAKPKRGPRAPGPPPANTSFHLTSPAPHGPVIYSDTTPVQPAMTQHAQPTEPIMNLADFQTKTPTITQAPINHPATTAGPAPATPPSSNPATAVNTPPNFPSAEPTYIGTHSTTATTDTRYSNMDIAQPYMPPTGLYEQMISSPPQQSTPNLHQQETFTAGAQVVPRPSHSDPSLSQQTTTYSTPPPLPPPPRPTPGRTTQPSSSVYSVYIPARHPSRIAQSGLSIRTETRGMHRSNRRPSQ